MYRMWYICVYIDLYMYFEEAHRKANFLTTLCELFAIGYQHK